MRCQHKVKPEGCRKRQCLRTCHGRSKKCWQHGGGDGKPDDFDCRKKPREEDQETPYNFICEDGRVYCVDNQRDDKGEFGCIIPPDKKGSSIDYTCSRDYKNLGKEAKYTCFRPTKLLPYAIYMHDGKPLSNYTKMFLDEFQYQMLMEKKVIVQARDVIPDILEVINDEGPDVMDVMNAYGGRVAFYFMHRNLDKSEVPNRLSLFKDYMAPSIGKIKGLVFYVIFGGEDNFKDISETINERMNTKFKKNEILQIKINMDGNKSNPAAAISESEAFNEIIKLVGQFKDLQSPPLRQD